MGTVPGPQLATEALSEGFRNTSLPIRGAKSPGFMVGPTLTAGSGGNAGTNINGLRKGKHEGQNQGKDDGPERRAFF